MSFFGVILTPDWLFEGVLLKSADLIKQVEAAGWVLISSKGSHHKFKHDDFDKPLIIPHPKKDLGKGIVSKILKQAGL